jgi:hypothetical protein
MSKLWVATMLLVALLVVGGTIWLILNNHFVYLLVALIGGLLGGCELLARYRDEPVQAVLNWAALFYVGVNVAASMVALLLIQIFEVSFGIDPAAGNQLATVQILAAGLGAMAFFRTSLFTARVGDQDVPLGPGYVIQILLNVTDRAVDRGRAKPRAEEIAEIMSDVDFMKAKTSLPPLCFGLMQNVSSEEQKAIADQVNLIVTPQPGESSRLQSILLGLLLLGLVGKDVLKAAIAALKGEIGAVGAAPTPPGQPAAAASPLGEDGQAQT